MKSKIIVPTILIVLAIVSSVVILNADGYFDSKKIDNKILANEQSATKTITLAKETSQIKTPIVAKKTAVVKKAPVKKVAPKKKVVPKKKSKLNLNPAPFTPTTAPFSAKNKYN